MNNVQQLKRELTRISKRSLMEKQADLSKSIKDTWNSITGKWDSLPPNTRRQLLIALGAVAGGSAGYGITGNPWVGAAGTALGGVGTSVAIRDHYDKLLGNNWLDRPEPNPRGFKKYDEKLVKDILKLAPEDRTPMEKDYLTTFDVSMHPIQNAITSFIAKQIDKHTLPKGYHSLPLEKMPFKFKKAIYGNN